MRLYLDTAPIIYYVEDVSPFAAAVQARLFPASDADSSTNGSETGAKKDKPILIISDLTRLECYVKPLRDRDAELIRDYEEFFMVVDETVPLSREVVDEATQIRAFYGFKTPDALHLAAALVAGCDAFYTNDHRLDRFSSLPVEIIDVS